MIYWVNMFCFFLFFLFLETSKRLWETKKRWKGKLKKNEKGVGIYDLNDNLMSIFKNNVELAKHLNISRVTVGKYLNSDLVYSKTYRFKINN